MKIQGKNYIANRIYRRFSGTIDKKTILVAVSVIEFEIGQILKSNQMISVKNFGTLNPVIRKCNGRDIKTGELFEKGSWSVRFSPNRIFRAMIENKFNTKEKKKFL